MCSCSWWLTSLQACFWFVVKEILNEFVIWPRAPINPLSPLQTSMCAWSPMLTMWPPRASTSPLSAPQWKPVNLRLRSNQLWSCWSPSTKSQSHVHCRFYQLIFNLLEIIKFLNYAQWVNVFFLSCSGLWLSVIFMSPQTMELKVRWEFNHSDGKTTIYPPTLTPCVSQWVSVWSSRTELMFSLGEINEMKLWFRKIVIECFF